MTDIISIRRAELSDLKLLSALAITTFYEAYYTQDDSGDLGEYVVEAFSLARLESELTDPKSTFFIAEIDKKAIGYAKLRKDSPAECLRDQNVIELQRIYVLAQAKGNGTGRKLIAKCLEEAGSEGFEAIWLGVWSQNILAQQFYEKLGFERIGELKFEYGAKLETNFVMKMGIL